MADISLTEAAYNWSTCNPNNGGGAPESGDTIYLNRTSPIVLTLDGAEGATYTCVAIKAQKSAADTTKTPGSIVITNYSVSPGPTLAFEAYAGTVPILTVASGKYVNSIIKVMGGSVNPSTGVINSGAIGTIGSAVGSATSNAYGYGVNNLNGGTIGTITSCVGGSTNDTAVINAAGAIITIITTATGGSGAASYGVNNSGNIGTVVNADGGTGGSLSFAAAGVYNMGTITNITNCNCTTGAGSGSGAVGLLNGANGVITNPIGKVKGGSHYLAWGMRNLNLGTFPTVAAVDNSGNTPPFGIPIKTPAGIWIGGVNAAATAAVNYTGGTGKLPYTRRRGALR